MSKKSKKKNKQKQKKAQKRFDRVRQKNRKNIEKKMKGKQIKATLSEKQSKKLNKILDELSDVPALKEPRKTCNHQGKKNMSLVLQSSYDGELFVVKNLEKMNEVFGEENVGICKKCRVAVPELDCIDMEDIDRAHMVLVGAVEHIVTRSDDKKEVELLHKAMKDVEATLKVIRKKFGKVKDKGVYRGGMVDKSMIRNDDDRRPARKRTTTIHKTEVAEIRTRLGAIVDPTVPYWEQGLTPGDTFEVNGRTITVQATEVAAQAAVTKSSAVSLKDFSKGDDED